MDKASQMSYGYSRKSQSVAIRFPIDKEALFSGWLKLVTQAKFQDEVMKIDLILNNPRLSVHFAINNVSLICWWSYTFVYYYC